jgi:hypothetical protein
MIDKKQFALNDCFLNLFLKLFQESKNAFSLATNVAESFLAATVVLIAICT